MLISSISKQILPISLQKFTKGFSDQKRAISGLRENANNDTGSVVKISQLEETEIEYMKQSKIPIHYIGEERSVWFFNNEIRIQGKKNVESASRKMIPNKSSDLIDKKANVDFRKFQTEQLR